MASAYRLGAFKNIYCGGDHNVPKFLTGMEAVIVAGGGKHFFSSVTTGQLLGGGLINNPPLYSSEQP